MNDTHIATAKLLEQQQSQWGWWASWSTCSFNCTGSDAERGRSQSRTRQVVVNGNGAKTMQCRGICRKVYLHLFEQNNSIGLDNANYTGKRIIASCPTSNEVRPTINVNNERHRGIAMLPEGFPFHQFNCALIHVTGCLPSSFPDNKTFVYMYV